MNSWKEKLSWKQPNFKLTEELYERFLSPQGKALSYYNDKRGELKEALIALEDIDDRAFVKATVETILRGEYAGNWLNRSREKLRKVI